MICLKEMNFELWFIVCLMIVLNTNVEASFEFIDAVVSAAFFTTSGTNDTRDLRIPNTINAESTFLETDGQLELWGYTSEKHKIITDDNYQIYIFRITGGPKSSNNKNKPAVYLQHGILTSSDSWILFGPGYDIALLLVELGFDVWLGNVRGNFYGKYNSNFTSYNKEFWHFSFHEMAVRDLPPIIDHILEVSGQKKLTYIGHSLGTAVSYVLLSEKPEYNEKMNLVISLAPICFWEKSPGIFWRFIVTVAPIILATASFFGIYSVLSRTTFASIVHSLCQDTSILRNVCVLAFILPFGKDTVNFNYRLVPYIGLYNPTEISWHTLIHFRQNIVAGNFQQFDHADPVQLYYHFGDTNKDVYGTDKPPTYDVTKISAPVALYYGNTDPVALQENVEYLAARLQNVVAMEKVQSKAFNHLDFLWGINVKKVLYDKLIPLILKHSM